MIEVLPRNHFHLMARALRWIHGKMKSYWHDHSSSGGWDCYYPRMSLDPRLPPSHHSRAIILRHHPRGNSLDDPGPM
jgi:hypothetical protein